MKTLILELSDELYEAVTRSAQAKRQPVSEYVANRLRGQSEEQIERTRIVTAIHEGEQAIQEGRTKPAEEVFSDLKAKHGF